MLGDNERSGAYAAEQRRMVRAGVAAEVLTFTPYWQEVAAETGLRLPGSPSDLQAMAPRPLHALGPPETLVLRPSPEAVRRNGPRPLRRELRRARLRRGRATAPRRILDPLYKPVHWIIEDETPVGCTEADLVRLAELGRRSLDLAGVGANDAIVGLVPPGPSLAGWQLALGAREAVIPLAGLTPDASLDAVTMLGPTVLAGRPNDLLRVLRGVDTGVRDTVLTVLTVTRAPLRPAERRALATAAGKQAEVVEMWAPPGVRALWAQCRGGEGVHTWPQAELLEVCGPDGAPAAEGEEGELVWTGLGWRGTVLVRLATGVRGRLVEGRCENCGRTTPRILDARSSAADRAPAPPVAGDVPSADEADHLVGRAKATGGIESVRTVRSRRREAPAAGAEVQPAAVPGTSSPKDEPEGTVRAVPKEEPAGAPSGDRHEGAADLASQDAGRRASAIGEVDHLPPVPDVGPDAGGEAPAEPGVDPWLPDTGEVDAWPAPVLASVEGLAAWQVEHRRRRGHDELVVHLALAEGAELGEVLVSLERSIGATQYVVGDEAAVAARVAGADGRRVVDARARGRTTNGDGGRRAALSGRRVSGEG